MFLKPDPLYDEVKPYAIASDPPPGIKKSNIMNTSYTTTIVNARRHENEFSLYSTGFEWVHQALELRLNTDEEIDQYIATMEAFLQNHLHAREVVAYDYVVSNIQCSFLSDTDHILQVRQQREAKEPRGPGVPRKIKKQILGAHLGIKTLLYRI